MRLIIALLFLSKTLYSQVENKFFIGSEIGLYNYSHLRADFEQQLLDGKYLIQVGYVTDLTDHLLQLKIGFRIFTIEKWKTRLYTYLPPYLNFNIIERKYNTPFCFELMKDWKLGKKFTLYSSINTDIFKDRIIPQARFRIKLFSWKKD